MTALSAPSNGAKWTAMNIIENMHAPAVGLSFLGATFYGILVLQKPAALPKKRRRTAIALAFGILTTFIAELIFYAIRMLASGNYHPPRSSVLNCLGSIIAWAPISVSLLTSDRVRWHPFLGAFILELTFDVAICLFAAFSINKRQSGSGSLIFDGLRALFSVLLTADWFSILIGRRSESGTDEEGQSLLGPGSIGGPNTSTVGYGTDGNGGSKTKTDPITDRQKELKDKQAKRLEEEGGWIGYLKGFLIFLPYVWPTNNPRVMFCLFLRVINLVQGRILNILAPRQLGIITDKLADGTTVMPWKDLALWAFYRWFRSGSGYGFVDSFAQMVIYQNSSARITQMAYKHVMSLSMDFHTSKDSGEVMRAVDQANAMNRLLDLVMFQLAPIFVDVIISAWYVTHLFNTYMAYIILYMALFYGWSTIAFTTWNRERRRDFTEKQRAETRVSNETLHNWHTVFYFNRTDYEHKRYAEALWTSIGAWYKYWIGANAAYALNDNLKLVSFMGCCTFAIHQIISGEAPVGNLITFIMYWETLLRPLTMVAYGYKEFTNVLIDAERLLQLLKTEPSVKDALNARPLAVSEGKVEFKDVSFAYDPRKEIIKDVSFTVEGGQTVAFVGETGGGKSTMLKLISRAYDTTNGSISIDGQNIREVTRSSLMDAMGLVPQAPELFNQSVRENIRYGRLEATDAEIEDVCRAAAIHDSIVEFPDGYESKVGERGVKLSGGQLQRIAIARVLLRGPKIVLLDEATSAVDSATEAHIQDAFRTLSAGRTTFVVAHRLSTIIQADQILVVDKGEIIERGTHADLLILGGKYAELWRKQTAGHEGFVTVSKTSSTLGDSDTERTKTDSQDEQKSQDASPSE